jgi:hypothetical protein
MQNRYVGDIGDYGKYALLRSLGGHDNPEPIRLAVVWCLFPDENFNNDGQYISYLDDTGFAELDPDLHSTLRSIVGTRRRKISAIEEDGLLPSSTVFFSEFISLPNSILTGALARIGYRNSWHQIIPTTGLGFLLVSPRKDDIPSSK